MDIMIAVAVGVFLLVAWTVGGWAIVRMGFTRDGDAARTPAHDDGAARPVHPGAAADPGGRRRRDGDDRAAVVPGLPDPPLGLRLNRGRPA